MPQLGDKYVSVETVAARIARNYKGVSFDLGDIAEWCFEVVKNIGRYEFFAEYKNQNIQIINKRAKLPCNVYRLLYVRNGNVVFPPQGYYYDGTYINLSDREISLPSSINIDYIGFVLDDNGLPMIEDGSQEACFWYCLTRLFLEDFVTGKIQGDKYAYMEAKYHHYVSQARGSMRWITTNDLENIHRTAITVIRDSTFPGTGKFNPRTQ